VDSFRIADGSMLDAARLKRAETIFNDLIGLTLPQRQAFLNSQPDEDVREFVERLLAHDDSGMTGFLGGPSCCAPQLAGRPELFHPAEQPAQIGDFQIIRKISEGGMGVVYEALQSNPSRTVALKVIRGGRFVDDYSLRLFQRETEALGRLRHPCVGAIYEAGHTDDGQHFIAMEFVQGCPLHAYVRTSSTSVRQRLELFRKICDAINYAHQRGVMHRDLKPSNILIDEEGHPKILDFGLARIADASLGVFTSETMTGRIQGTLSYMSPEQARGDPDAIDIRSDVYSLGVILYELLADHLPVDPTGESLPQAVKMICFEPPRKSRALRGDFETIVLKALEKDPRRRYGSAADLAEDIGRHLSHQPILARPATPVYQLRKFVMRHKWPCAFTATLLVVLSLAGAWTARAMMLERRAAQRAMVTNEFMTDVLADADPAIGRADVQLVEVLRSAADEAAGRFAEHPEVEADVRYLLARAFRNLTLYEDALPQVTRAYVLRRDTLGPGDPATIEAGSVRAWLLYRLRRLDEASRVAQEVAAATPADQVNSEASLGLRRTAAMINMLRGEFGETEAELRDVIHAARETLGAEHRTTLVSINDLAYFYSVRAQNPKGVDRAGDMQNSADLLASIVEPCQRVLGESALMTLIVRNGLAQSLSKLNHHAEAFLHAQQVLATAAPRFGADHELCSRALGVMAEAEFGQRHFQSAAEHAVRAVEMMRRRTGGQDTMESLAFMSDWLFILDAADDLDRAVEYARVLDEQFKNLGGHGTSPVRYQALHARFVSRAGSLEKADELIARLLDLEPSVPDGFARSCIDLAVGGHLAARGQYHEAEQRLLRVHELPAASPFPMDDRRKVVARQELARLYEAMGKPDEAEKWHALAGKPAEPRPDALRPGRTR
jgi:eukaryotic-like serine/threonine-protein kinase